VEEACQTGNFGGEVAALVADEAFHSLKAPIKRVAGLNTPIPANRFLESLFIPNEAKITAAVRSVISE
jgi:pyruvate dehydrogenase E1 component beta subunit